MATPERIPVTGQAGVVLARSIEQDVQVGQAGGNTARIGPGVVDAVRQQQRPGVVGRDPSQLSTCHPKRCQGPLEQDVTASGDGREYQLELALPATIPPAMRDRVSATLRSSAVTRPS